MKLDYDLIRDILLTIERLEYKTFLTNDTALSMSLLSKYNTIDIEYAIKKISEAGFIDSDYVHCTLDLHVIYSIPELTWQGHQALDTIRNNTVWEKTKKHISKTVQSASLKIMIDVAKRVADSIIF